MEDFEHDFEILVFPDLATKELVLEANENYKDKPILVGDIQYLKEQINEMLKTCEKLLDKDQNFFILNLYSLGFSALIVENLIKTIFGNVQNLEIGELYIKDNFDKKLPLGVYCRFFNQ